MKRENTIRENKNGSVLDAIFEVSSPISMVDEAERRNNAIKATTESLSRQMSLALKEKVIASSVTQCLLKSKVETRKLVELRTAD